MAGKRSKTRSFIAGFNIDLDKPPQREILGLLLLALGSVTLLSLLSITHGALSDRWAELLRCLFGWGAFPMALGLGATGAILLGRNIGRPLAIGWERVIGLEVLFVVGLAMLHLLSPAEDPLRLAEEGGGGGYLGWAISYLLIKSIGRWGSFTALLITGLISLMVSLDISWQDIGHGVAKLAAAVAFLYRRVTAPYPRADVSPPLPGEEGALKPARQKEGVVVSPSTPRRRAAARREKRVSRPPKGRDQRLPPLDLLNYAAVEAFSESEARHKTKIIEETLASFGVPVKVVEISRGPTITQFGVEPGYIEKRGSNGRIKQRKVRVSQISALADDLALALAAAPIRIQAPVPGHSIVGIEVPNSKVSLVALRGVMESEEFQALDSKLKLALGRDVSGQPVVADLATMPHLLIAGATGSGKSVCINCIIACLLCNNIPQDLKLLMIDPKRVELTNFNGIPHLLIPVVVEIAQVVRALKWVTQEMDRRFKLFARSEVREIESYNRLPASRREEHLPYIIIIIDELADLMMVAPEEVERLVCRIAQLARATGIHLVMATQRPSVDVVTGLIKANFPARISFAVASHVDSRVVLDTSGAEKLLGRGDMLYMASDSSKLLRLQGSYVSDEELAKLVSFWREKSVSDLSRAAPSPLWDKIIAGEEEEADELLEEAIELVQRHEQASASFLQRKLRIGYPRAARLIDQLEERGIIGPAVEGGRSREVLVPQLEESVEDSSLGEKN